ncbi:hypothetical protein [Pseudalkalibacillus caeni]|uniref:DUF4064 domain-containing protein n=1 Tax=Exobacillus caeni TaxID=2574798 RepID=A0A5R9FB39_9BACL|nr:hypothetical protein [Pseudalkalibacillus caeni]TLS38878.1 hypothetical protein FCL54_00760 [Pseudalkalibacillus caeni]
MKRALCFALCGFILSVAAAVLPLLDIVSFYNLREVSTFTALMFPALAGIGCYLLKQRPIIAGFLLIISAVGGIIFLSIFYIIPSLFLITSGFMGIVLKEESEQCSHP